MTDSARTLCRAPAACRARGSGHCPGCVAYHNATDPEIRARRTAAIRTKHAEPAFRAAHRQRAIARLEEVRRRRGPEWLREQGRAMQRVAQTEEVRAKVRATRSAVGRLLAERAIAWCPLAYREEYRRLVRSRQATGSEARVLIEEQVATDARREVAREAADMLARHEREKAQRY